MDSRVTRDGGSLFNQERVSAPKHWDSARELVSSEPPTPDDIPTTLLGEPLDSAEKVLEFLANRFWTNSIFFPGLTIFRRT